MILYGFWRSTATWRVRIVLATKGIAYEYRPVNLRREGGGEQHDGAYRALNPMRQVPLLVTEEGGREVRLAQSVAIAEYIEERFPDPPLLPADRLARARVRQIVEIINSGIQPLQNTAVQIHVKDDLGRDDVAWIKTWVGRGLEALEAAVRDTAGAFAVGDALTLADVFIAPQIDFARRFAIDLGPHPTLVRVEAATAGLPAFRDAHALRQIDAPH